jgi:hypothetical protein
VIKNALVVAALTFALGACADAVKPVPPAPTVVVSGCEHFSLITVSRKDTPDTREQVLAYNAEYLKTCGIPQAK